jgi:hypothetical protein
MYLCMGIHVLTIKLLTFNVHNLRICEIISIRTLTLINNDEIIKKN